MNRKKIRNAGKGNIVEKTKRKIRNKWVSKLRFTGVYKYCYKSYWHSLMNDRTQESSDALYFAARPNPGAGIGHQMANWIAGYWFAEQFGLKFAHIPFASDKWEKFLGFYQNEETFNDLEKRGYRVVRIQAFDELNEEEVSRIRKIIHSYNGRKIIFLVEQDQFYHDQYGVMYQIQNKFYSCPERKNNNLIYSSNAFNIAVHVRRGDIVQRQEKTNENLLMRFQANDYFVNALRSALEILKDKKNIHIYLFSQGVPEDYPEFRQFENIHYCLDMGAQESFLHMVYADALITSKSSFSYKPALLSRGIKFCPKDFWHGYPDKADWILLDADGIIDTQS